MVQLYKDRGKETNVQGQSEWYKCMMTEVKVQFDKDRGKGTLVQLYTDRATSINV